MRKKKGLVHPLRTRVYRQYTPNEFSQEPGMPHIMQVNQQHAANKRKYKLKVAFILGLTCFRIKIFRV